MRRFLRWKWLLAFSVIGLILSLAAPLAARAYVRWQGLSRLAEAIRELDETDPGWTKDELCATRNAGLAPPGRNSFTVVREVRAALPADFDKRKDPLETARVQPANVCLSDEEYELLRKQVADCKAAIEVARRLADLPEGGRTFEFDELPISTNLEEIQQVRGVAAILHQDAVLAAQEGRGSDAIRDARAVLNAGRSIGDEPCTISQLVRTACVAIACRTAGKTLGLTEPKDGLAELQAELLREADFPRLHHAFRGERASIHQTFLLMETGDINKIAGPPGVPGGTGGGLLGRISMWGFRTYLPDDHVFSLKMMTAGVEAGRRPFDEQLAALKGIPEPRDGDRRHLLSGLLLPAVKKLGESGLRIRGELLATTVAVACERHRQRTGEWPASLDSIPKDILPAVPTDPFTGKPMSYVRRPDGIVVYSIGPDERDDGGNVSSEPGGGRPQSDFGVRLWDPKLRRQPPPPPEPKNPTDPGPGEPGFNDR